jgi:hypothetical protein
MAYDAIFNYFSLYSLKYEKYKQGLQADNLMHDGFVSSSLISNQPNERRRNINLRPRSEVPFFGSTDQLLL